MLKTGKSCQCHYQNKGLITMLACNPVKYSGLKPSITMTTWLDSASNFTLLTLVNSVSALRARHKCGWKSSVKNGYATVDLSYHKNPFRTHVCSKHRADFSSTIMNDRYNILAWRPPIPPHTHCGNLIITMTPQFGTSGTPVTRKVMLFTLFASADRVTVTTVLIWRHHLLPHLMANMAHPELPDVLCWPDWKLTIVIHADGAWWRPSWNPLK